MAATSNPSEDHQIIEELNQIRSQLNKKQTFETAITSLKTLLLQSYSHSSPPTQLLFYDVVSRVATVLRTRYTALGFLISGLDVLDTATRILTLSPSQSSHLSSSISSLRQSLPSDDDQPDHHYHDQLARRGRYLFEGHLTVDPEPPQPSWLAQQNLLAALASQSESNINDNDNGTSGNDVGSLLRGMVENIDMTDAAMMQGLEEFLAADVTGGGGRGAPPASKEVVEKLPVVKVDEEVMAKVGEDAECCICKEKFGVGDEMQEMPCKHLFHPLCLKPWLDEHNSCPICRHELPTDDHKYESRKEREKELEEERRGAANALPGGEFMYI